MTLNIMLMLLIHYNKKVRHGVPSDCLWILVYLYFWRNGGPKTIFDNVLPYIFLESIKYFRQDFAPNPLLQILCGSKTPQHFVVTPIKLKFLVKVFPI